MYDELVKRLRYKAGWDESGDLEQAADAIEELIRIERDFRQYISDQVKREGCVRLLLLQEPRKRKQV